MLSAWTVSCPCRSPLACNASDQAWLPGAGNARVPVASSGQSPLGVRCPCSSSARSSRRRLTRSRVSPSASQVARSWRSASSASPSRLRRPRRTSPRRMPTGSARAGRRTGPSSVLPPSPGNDRATSSAASWSMHSVMPSRQPGCQSRRGAVIATELSPWRHTTRCACHWPPRWPLKPSTSNPGTRPSAQRAPPSLPSSQAPIAPTPARVSPRASNAPLTTRLTAPAPWRSGCGSRLDHPGPWPGRGGWGPPGRPSARRCRRRS